MIKKDNTRIAITISKTLHKKLKEEAEYEGRSVSNMATAIIKNFFENKDKINKE